MKHQCIDDTNDSFKREVKLRKVFIVGLPKCDTTSFHTYFSKLGYKSCHWKIGKQFIGQIMMDNYKKGRPILDSLEEYDIFTQMDVIEKMEDGKTISIWPQISLLEQLIDQHPNAYYILNTRDPTTHTESLMSYDLRRQLLHECDVPGLPIGKGKNAPEIREWVELHNQKIREFFRERPALNFIEINIEKDSVIDYLCKFLQTDLSAVNNQVNNFPHMNSRNKRR